MVILRCSRHSSSGSVTRRSHVDRSCGRGPRRWRLGGRRVSSVGGATLDAIDAASSLGGHRANVPGPPPCTPGLPALRRRGLDETAPPFTPSTRHVTNSGSSPTSAEPRRVTQAPRDRFGSACASSSLGPWSDDPSASVGGRDRTISAARIRSCSTPGSCTRAFPYSPTVARFDPRQAGQTLNHGFPRWPVHKPSFRKK